MKNPNPLWYSVIIIALLSITTICGCNNADDNTATCTDGLMNGNEAGVDCGGSCNACTANQFLIKTSTYSTTGYSRNELYTYNDKGQVTKIITVENGDTSTATYTYSGNTITLNEYNIISTYTLNAQGYAASWGASDYTYDADWHLLSTGVFSFTWSGGNMASASSPSTTYTNTYTDKLSTIEHVNFGKGFLGKGSTNLIDTYTLVNNGTTRTYTYQFDSQNRVIQSNDGEAISTYTYY